MNRSQALILGTITLALAAGCEDESSAATSGPTSTGAGATGASTSAATGSGGASATTSTTISTGGATASGGAGGSTASGGSGGTGGSGGALAFSFFVTSVGTGTDGGNLGGLTGADTICQDLATAAGVGAGTWRAYLSTTAENARDRIGTGPWTNFDGDTVALNVTALHTDGLSNGNPQYMLDETGTPAPVNEHDIFTGSQGDGTLSTNATCQDWTSASTQDVARVGHSDIPGNPMFSPSWNDAHDTLNCSENGVIARGGNGRLYCFAL